MGKGTEKMEGDLLWKQYDRFVNQLREDVRELYWLFNFFWVIDGGLFALYIKSDFIKPNLENTVIWVGLIISALWFWITRKQILYRNGWIKKIKALEGDFIDDHRMWPDEKLSPRKWFFDFLFGKIRIARAMLIIPCGFFVLWLYLLLQ